MFFTVLLMVRLAPIRRYADVVVHHQLLASLTERTPLHTNKPMTEESRALPSSAVVSMLTENENRDLLGDKMQERRSQSPTAVETVAPKEKAVQNEPLNPILGINAKEIVESSIIGTSNDLEIDNLIDGAQDLLLGDADGATDLEIDELIGDATELVSDWKDQSAEKEDLDIDAVIDGTDALVIGDTGGTTAAACSPEDLEIDALIGGSEDFEIDALIGSASDLVTNDASPEEPSRTANVVTLSGEERAGKPRGVGATIEVEMKDEGEPSPSEKSGSSFLHSRTTGRRDEELLSKTNDRLMNNARSDESYEHRPFSGNDVSTICESLNQHTRLAKQCSFECQGLFLSLFFKNNTEVTEAVVCKLKENGFEAYIPRFDLRAPVYLRDSDGYVQMDPSLLGLPSDSGQDATLGFAWSKNCRRFRRDDVMLQFTPGEELAVRRQGTTRLTMKALDVVSVEIFCSDWDQRARIPSPRVLLVPNHHKKSPATSVTDGGTEVKAPRTNPETSVVAAGSLTVFDIVESAIQAPDRLSLPRAFRDKENSARLELLRGRIVFGNFVNPNTKMAEQLVAQEAAAAEAIQRRNNAVQRAARRDEDSSTRRIEREVTGRQQRLAKEKRESRRAKKN